MRKDGRMERFRPWLPESYKHYGHAWIPVEKPVPLRAEWCTWSEPWLEICWCPWSKLLQADMGEEVFVCLFFAVVSMTQNHKWEWETLMVSETTPQKRSSRNRKLLTSVLKNCDKDDEGLLFTVDGFLWQSGTDSGFFNSYWECDRVLMSIRATKIWFGGFFFF